jgi:hypothetical protein
MKPQTIKDPFEQLAKAEAKRKRNLKYQREVLAQKKAMKKERKKIINLNFSL